MWAPRSRIAVTFLLLAWLSTCSLARAGFNFTSETRSATVSLNVFPGGSQFMSSVLGGFYQTTASVDDGFHFGYSTQTLTSDLQPELMYFTGGWTGHWPSRTGTGTSDGRVDATINFTVSQDTTVLLALNAFLTDPAGPLGNRYVKLTGPGTNIAFNVQHMVPPEYLNYTGPISQSQSATLAPGAYTLSMSMASYSYSDQGHDLRGGVTSYDVRLSIPEPSSAACVLILLPALARRKR